MTKLLENPIIREQFEGKKTGFFSAVGGKRGVFFVMYPCRIDSVMNVAVFHDTRPGHEDDEGWQSPATIEEVRSVVDDVHPLWTAIVESAAPDTFKCFPITFRDILPRYNKGRAILLGDSAHPMQPSHAQGATVSIEDAAALEVLLRDCPTASVPKRCQLWNDFRVPRDNTTVLYSNVLFYNLDGVEDVKQHEDRIREFYQGPLMTFKQQFWSRPHQEFFYPYDVYAEAEKAMEWKDKEERLPNDAVKHFF